ncbi:uncharacterized protein [Apostichopus japonicus]|uniref:uncharacterized protein isoform X1 n=1 Tax=Stichopus japonicus TaxID=307972 RepID=UPI003AB32277
MQEKIRSAEKDFCVLGNPDNCPCPDIRPEDLPLPTLPSFDRVTTEAFSTEEVMTTLLTSTETPVVRVKGEETTLLPGINDTTDRQVCCQASVYILIAFLIVVFLAILLCLIIKYLRKSKLRDAYSPGPPNGPDPNKAEAKNGAKSENPAEVVPLKSQNWNGSEGTAV